MKHKTWFRLVLKAIGILLIGLVLPEIIQSIFFIIDDLDASAPLAWMGYSKTYIFILAGFRKNFVST